MSNFGIIDKNIFNDAFRGFFQSTKRYQHCMGGGGSGKSKAITQKVLFTYFLSFKSKEQWYKAMQLKYPKNELDRLIASGKLKPTNIRPWKEKIVLLRSTQNLIRHSQFEELRSLILKYNLDVKINESTMSMKAANGNEIISAGIKLGGAERLKSISGITRFWVEEATDGGISLDDIDQLDTRLRTPYCPDPCIIMSYNPVHEGHWINQYYWKEKMPNTDKPLPDSIKERFRKTLFKSITTYKDNKFLPQSYIDQLEAKQETNPNNHRIYAQAIWGGSPEGCIFKNWAKVGGFPNACDKFVYGIDKGMSHPYAIVKCSFLPIDIYTTEIIDGEVLPVIVAQKGIYAQEVAYQKGFTTPEMIKKYGPLMNKEYSCYISPEAASDKKDWATSGWNVSDAKNKVSDGIKFIQDYPIFVVSNEENYSLNVISELQEYKYQFSKLIGAYTDVPAKIMDDAMDAMRYGVFSAFGSVKYSGIDMTV